MEQKKSHKPFGGSNVHRWLRCPGSVGLCATLPPRPPSADMERGTRAHSILEVALNKEYENALDFMPPSNNEEAQDVAAVNVALHYINGLINSDPGSGNWTEHPLDLLPDVGGTADAVVFLPSSRTLHVIDYKHGSGKFVSEDSEQTKFYALLHLLHLKALGSSIDTVVCTIIQPRYRDGSVKPIRSVEYKREDILAFESEVRAAVDKAKTSKELIPGETQCPWCPAASTCPALIGMTGVIDYSNQVVVSNGTRTLTLPDVGLLRGSGAKIAEVLAAAPFIRQWLDAVDALAEEQAKGGMTIPGFKLVQKQGRRVWADEDKAKKFLETETFLSEDEYAPRQVLSVARAEKAVKEFNFPAAIRDKLMKSMSEIVTRESSGLKLAPESAKGDAVIPLELAAGDFASSVVIGDEPS